MTAFKHIAAALLLSTAGISAQAETELNVVAPWSTLNAYGAVEAPFWIEAFPEKTGGDLTAKLSNYSELGLGGAELLRLASMGVFDVAHIVVGYSVSDDPVIEGIELAGVIQDLDTLRQAVDAYEPTMTTDLAEKHNLVYLGMYPNPSQVMYCSEPVTGLDDFQGKKIRFYGSSMNDFIEAAGGTGVSVALAEVVPALQRGVVDCAFTGTLTGYSFKFPEVTSDLYGLRLGWGLTFIAANKAAFDALTPEQQSLLRSSTKELEGQLWDLVAKDDEAGIACNTGEGECPYGEPAGMSFVPVSEEDDARRRALLEDKILKSWAARCDDACIANWNETVGSLTGLTAAK
jgi:TRAP-type C4-dicarboxylate transport system substrate-binding protein